MDSEQITPTRRQVLSGVTVGALATAWGIEQSTAQQVVDASGGSPQAAANAMNVAGELYIGPSQLLEAVDSAPDRLFVAVDSSPQLYDPSGTLSHSVVAQGSGLPAFVAPTESELAVPPSTPAVAVVDTAGVRIATEGSFSTSQKFGDTNMKRARSIHVAEQISDLPTPDQTPAIAVTANDGPVVFD